MSRRGWTLLALVLGVAALFAVQGVDPLGSLVPTDPMDGDVTLRVRLVDAESGEPLPNLRISEVIFREDSDHFGELGRLNVFTDAEGVFEIQGFHTHRIRFFVVVDGLAPMKAFHPIERQPDDPRVAETTLGLQRARTLEGQIEGLEAKAADRIVLLVEIDGEPEPVEAPVRPDASFRLEGLRPERVRLSAYGTGSRGPSVGFAEGVPGEGVLRLSLRKPRQEERVLLEIRTVDPAGLPIDATVTASLDGTHHEAKTKGGVARVFARYGTTDSIRLDAFPEPPDGLGGVVRRDLQIDDFPCTLRLPPERVLEGRLLGEDGRPVENAGVILRPLHSWSWRPHATDRTAGDGTFRLRGLGAMAYEVAFEWTGGPSIVPSVVDETATALSRDLSREHAVAIRVLRGTGDEAQPAAKASVHIGGFAGASDRLPAARILVETTDDEGRLRVVGLDPEGTYSLTVEGRKDVRSWKPEDTVVRLEPSPEEDLNVRFDQPVRVRIVLKGVRHVDAMRPVLWRFGDEGGSRVMPGFDIGLDGHGRVDIPGNPDEIDRKLELWIPNLQDGRYVHARGLDALEAPHEVEAKQGATIRGRIECPEGFEAQRPFVFLVGPLMSSAFLQGVEGMPGTLPVTVDEATGRFEVVGVPPGSWRFNVWGAVKGKGAMWDVEAEAGAEDVLIRLTPETADILD